MRGDVWLGGVGTTTYTTADGKLVAYGHPGMWDGYLTAYLTNADVIGLWNNAEEPHKVVAPGKVRGSITVDSGPGIAGVVGDTAIPDDVPLTCSATNAATGKTVTTTSYATQWAADQHKWPYWSAYALSFWPAMYQATGDQQYDGHLTYTLTINMTNGSQDYAITRTNTWEDSYGFDASYLAITDIASLLTTLTADPDGTIDPHITAIDLACTLSPQHDRARVADVAVPGGIHEGVNTVEVTIYAYGLTTPVIVDVPLTIPDGMSTKGMIYAKAPFTNVESMGDGWYGFWSYLRPEHRVRRRPWRTSSPLSTPPPGNDQLLVAYDPAGRRRGRQLGHGRAVGRRRGRHAGPHGHLPHRVGIEVTGRHLDLSGELAGCRRTAAHAHGQPQCRGGRPRGSTIKIYTRDAGETTDTLLMEVPVESLTSGDSVENTFTAEIPAAKHTTTVTAAWDGNDTYLRSTASALVEVQAVVNLRTQVTRAGVARLTAKLRPADTGGKVAFMLVKRGGPSLLRRVAVGADGTATWSWKPRAGAYRVKAVFLGSDRNTSASSRTISVIVQIGTARTDVGDGPGRPVSTLRAAEHNRSAALGRDCSSTNDITELTVDLVPATARGPNTPGYTSSATDDRTRNRAATRRTTCRCVGCRPGSAARRRRSRRPRQARRR